MANPDFLPEVAVMAPNLDTLPVTMLVAISVTIMIVVTTAVITAGL